MIRFAVVVALLAAAAESKTIHKRAAGPWVNYNGAEYLFVKETKSWNDAQAYCHAQGSSLATPEGAVENTWIGQQVKTRGLANPWIGVNDQTNEKIYTRPDGTRVTYILWAPNEPNQSGGNEDCVHILTTNKWNDLPCSNKLAFVCKKTGCAARKADIVFVVDASGSVGITNFNKQKQFVEDVINSFDVGQNKVRIGMVTFDSQVYNQFHLNKHNSKATMISAVKAVRYTRGSTNTADAIKYFVTQSFSAANGARSGVPHIAIFLTDGRSNSPASTIREAATAHKNNINVFAIGIGTNLNMNELNALGTDPDSENVFQVANFNALGAIKSKITQKTCEAPVVPTNPPSVVTLPPVVTATPLKPYIPMKVVGAPDNKGTRFIFAFGENFSFGDINDLEVFVTTFEDGPVRGRITSPLHKNPKVDQSFTLNKGDVKQISFSNLLRLKGTSKEDKAILVESDKEVVVYAFNKEKHSVDGFMALPVDMLGTKYFTSSFHPATRKTQIQIVGAYDNSNVKIHLLNPNTGTVTYKGKTYKAGDVINVPLNQYETFQLQSTGDLTGTMIESDRAVAVLSGNIKTSTDGKASQDHLVEMIPPVRTWGKKFITTPTPGRNDGDFYRIIASEDNTKVSIPGKGTYTLAKAGDYKQISLPSDTSYVINTDKPALAMQFVKTSNAGLNSDPSMIMIPPVEQWSDHYTFTTPQGISGAYKNYINVQMRKKDINGMYLNGKPISNKIWKPIAGTNFVTAQIPISHGTYDIQHTNPTVTFGTSMYGGAPDESYGYPAGMRLASINGACTLTPTIVGDGLDNDCDGKIDEELPNGIDDDGDGKIDEDLAKTLALVTSAPAVCGTSPADIVFVLDGSGSVGQANFKKQLNFIKDVVNNFEIAPDKVRVGIVKFSSRVNSEFHLNKYSTKSSLMAAIDNIKFQGGTTHTGEALEYMHETAFNVLNGDRPGVVNMGIVMTDGQSASKPLTLSEAKKAKNKGIDMIAIGIGSNLAEDELDAIASRPDQVFKATDFDALKSIETKLAKVTCEVPKATTAPPTVPSTKADCDIQADVMFLLDTSGSVGAPNFKKVTNFVKDVVSGFDIGPNKARVGVVKYSSAVYPEFDLTAHTDKTALLSAIDGIAFKSGTTKTDRGLKYLHDTSFTAAKGDRAGVSNIAVVVTDGKSDNKAATIAEAKKLHAKGVKVFAIGIGKGITKDELNAIGSDPDSQYVYSVDTFDSLTGFKDMFSTQACKVVPNKITTPPTPTINDCDREADFMLVLDSSGSVTAPNFQKMLTFVNSLVDELAIAKDKAQVGVLRYNNRPYLSFHMNKYTNNQDVKNAVSNIKYSGGGTNTAEAIKYMREQGFNPGNGARQGVPKIGIVITDGKSVSRSKTIQEAENARKQGITMYAIGVGSGVDMAELNGIGNDPKDQHVFAVKDFDALEAIKKQLAVKACAPKPTQPPTTLNPNRCRDRIPNCGDYSSSVCTGDFKSWAQTNCQLYCGFCTTDAPNVVITIPPPSTCVDKKDNCATYGSDFCTDFKDFAADNCPKYCGYCSGTNTITGGYYNKCYYKGNQYNTGETWKDGCDYECTCDDAKQGLYTCYNLCPVYYNLPKQCVLTAVPGECCKKPVCDFGSSVITTTDYGKGKQNGLDVCVYDGQKYYQGVSWQDGCDKECRCIDASTGSYSCQSLCPVYSNLPSVCKTVPQPGKCCEELVCDWPKQVGTITGTGTVTGPGTQVTVPKPAAVCSDKVANCNAYGKSVCSNPDFVSWAADNCAKYCDLCKFNQDPCYYQGRQYTQGQTWTDGCRQCVCEDATNGFYRCTDNCPVYTNLPTQCKEVKKDGECCTKVECDYGTFVPSITGPIKPGTGTGIVVTGNATPPPGTVIVPPTPNNKIEGCMYKGKLYPEAMRWEDGCDYVCECINGKTGSYRCGAKCPVWNNLPAACKLEDVAGDPCCQYPSCTGPVTPGTVIPTYPKGITGTSPVVPTGTGTVVGPVPTPRPGSTTKTPPVVANDVCVYKGKNYKQGVTWPDGCDYRCECIDASIGYYRCTDRCASYTNLPSSCSLVTDPKDSCCKVPKCDMSVTPTPSVVTPPKPIMNECIYNGRSYSQGQAFNDGCALKCVCEDAKTGYYRCQNRCPSYTSIPANCQLVADPNDPTCCKVPRCDLNPGTNVKPGTVVTPEGVIGTFTGTGKPVVTTNTGTIGSNRDVCIYGNQVYRQGDRWDDGCQYECECIDAPNGKYRCNDKCPRYAALPAECKLVIDPFNPCCQKPQCTFTPSTGTNTGVCADVASNCADYSSDSCKPPYDSWSRANCAKTCGFCGRTTIYVPPSPTTSGPTVPLPAYCQDRILNCNDYGSYVCRGDYIPWALENCVRTCRLCHLVTTRGPIITAATAPTPKPRNYCVYKGTNYNTGDNWDDGCQYSCTCENQDTGLWKCTEKCPTWNNLPSVCRMNPPLPGNCCPYPTCSGGGHTLVYPTGVKPETGVNTGTPGGVTVPGTGKVITGVGSVTNRPQVITPTTQKPVQADFCVYKGTSYRQGASWDDGCQYTCTCENARTGQWKCVEKCPTFTNMPSGCRMNPPLPGNCCPYPTCPTGNTIIYPTGTKPETGVSTGTPGGVSVPGTGTSVTGVGTVTNKPITVTVSPALTTKYCVYKGTNYKQGASWDDGCQYTCTCEDANAGRWKCVEKCPTFTNMPSGCRMNPPLPGNCCPYPTCPTGNTIIYPTGTKPETGVSTGTPGGTSVPGTSTSVTGVGTVTNKPITVTVSPTLTTKYCVYKGTNYKQGASWDDGCQYTCTCEDANAGRWKCVEKCPTFTNMPSGCRMNPPLPGNCCPYPTCPTGNTIIYPTGTKPETGVSTGTPGGTSVPGTSTSVTGVGTVTNKPITVTVSPTLTTKYCVYKGTNYRQGASWDDGCQYTCTCEDANAGRWKCVEKCPVFTNMPSGCRMNPPLPGNCCPYPTCPTGNTIIYPTGTKPETGVSTGTPGGVSVPGTGTSITGVGTVTNKPITVTVSPALTTKYCVYKGTNYKQGASWDDGCQFSCTCEDANAGRWKCVEKCPKWTNLPAACRMSPPLPGNCCSYPSCGDGYTIVYPTGTKPEAGVTTGTPGGTSVPGTSTSVTGVGSVTNKPVTVTGRPPIVMGDGCTYKGTKYAQGQTWDDACLYSCVCENGKTGAWKCQAKCPSWTGLPAACSLNPPLPGNCCNYPTCPTGYKIIYPTGYKPEAGVNIGTGTGTAVTGTGGGSGTTGTNTGTGTSTGCLYTDGTAHKVGETWEDGCKYYCTCKDAAGNYECRERCLKWTLPAGCTMRPPLPNFCCGMPKCSSSITFQFPDGYEKETGYYGNGDRYIPGGTVAPGTKAVSGTLNTKSGTASASGTGYTSGCLFSNKVYAQGAQWEDGCSFICTCQDGATGRYTCSARCMTWNLPSVCKMLPPMGGKCCSEPSCPAGYSLTYPAGYNKNLYWTRGSITDTGNAVITGTTGCKYTDGKVYGTGQTWKTGCSQAAMRCTCEDGATGKYTCRGLCTTWTLPPECSLSPPSPGKCCAKPSCPSTVTIQYPPGYKEE